MKKNSKSRNLNKELYCIFDNNEYICNDTRFYGLFIGKNKRFRIDPKRFDKKIGLSKEQLDFMSKRNTHYFYPDTRNYKDYFSNYLRDELQFLKNEWNNDFKPMIERTVNRIKSKKYNPGDDMSLHCGISSVGAANARAQWYTYLSEENATYKKTMLITSLYAQFFHYMTSQIEKILVKVLTKKKLIKSDYNRGILYDLIEINNTKKEDIKGYYYFDRMYCIWNFIKHNNNSTFLALKEKYPDILLGDEYKDGNNAIHYVKIDDIIINETIQNVELFLSDICRVLLDEDYISAEWNYEKYFLKKVKDEIGSIDNPLGLDLFDDID